VCPPFIFTFSGSLLLSVSCLRLSCTPQTYFLSLIVQVVWSFRGERILKFGVGISALPALFAPFLCSLCLQSCVSSLLCPALPCPALPCLALPCPALTCPTLLCVWIQSLIPWGRFYLLYIYI